MSTSNEQTPALRYTIIGGAASITTLHTEALKQTPGSQLVAISDLSFERGQQRADELGCTFYTDHQLMLAEHRPDVAIICTPHPFHAPLAIDSLRSGAHVLVEKPLAVEVAEGDAMIAAAQTTGKILAINFQHRFRPQIAFMKQFIEAGELGDLVRVLMIAPWFRPAVYYRSAGWRGTWKGEGGGVLMNQAPHNLDLLCYLVGMPARVWGWTRTRVHTIECEDSAQAMLEFANGASGFLYGSTVDIGEEKLDIIGDRAALEMRGGQVYVTRYEQPLSTFRVEATGLFDSPRRSTETATLPETKGDHVAIHHDLRRAILNHGMPRADGAEGLKSLELANAIILSSHLERPVSLPVDRNAYHELLEQLRAN